jgi:hypothetical protein
MSAKTNPSLSIMRLKFDLKKYPWAKKLGAMPLDGPNYYGWAVKGWPSGMGTYTDWTVMRFIKREILERAMKIPGKWVKA